MLKDSDTSDSLGGAEKTLQHYDLLLTQAKVRRRCGNRDLKAFRVFYQHFSHILPKSKTFTVNCRFYCYWKEESHLTACALFQEKQQYAVTLVTEAEEIVGLGRSCPATDIFGTLVRTFKSDMDDFMLRAEQRHRELETVLHVHSFCAQVCVSSQLTFPSVVTSLH